MLIPFGTHSYQHEARQLSSQQMVNCFIEAQPPNAKASTAVIRSPGVTELVEFVTSPVRGAAEHDGVSYFVSGQKLYSLSGTVMTLQGDIGGTDRVTMFSNGAQLGIFANKTLYIYEDGLGTVKIKDEGFVGAIDAAYLDLFGVFVKEDSQDIFINNAGAPSFPDLNDFNALDFRTVEAAPGNIVAIESDHRELIIFKEKGAEFWVNTSNPDFTFAPLPNAHMELGCIAKHSVAQADNTIFWLANDMTVRKVQGYVPVRVSTHAIENIITKMTTTDDAIAFSYPFNGHLFYNLTFPTEQRTFVFDITTGAWHERESDGEEWRGGFYLYSNGNHYIADRNSGKVGLLSGQTYTDFGDVHRVSVTSPPIQSEGNEIFFSRLQIDFEMGRGLTTGQGSDPQVMLQWSDDGGLTWSSEYWRSIGRIGKYGKRAVWHRLGSSRDRVFRLSFSDPSPFTIIQAIADVEVGTA